ncbi:OmpH family outer membrane protein [Aquimarina sp. 2201CG1-2-11]|uniref:OmpH family outer membrane protein n=1 Tax=Aquimarina discodermiae TaxID=3231043 RepID=UPI003461959E
MNKVTILLSTIAIAFSIFSFINFKHSSAQVYVDVNQLIDGYTRTKVEREAFQKKANTLKANVDSLITNWQSELKAYEKERTSLSKKEVALKKELLANKQQQINNYQQAIQKQIQEEDQKMTQTVVNDINDYIKEYGKENGYKIILGASGSGNIMFADETADLTTEVLDGLNTEYEIN